MDSITNALSLIWSHVHVVKAEFALNALLCDVFCLFATVRSKKEVDLYKNLVKDKFNFFVSHYKVTLLKIGYLRRLIRRKKLKKKIKFHQMQFS